MKSTFFLTLATIIAVGVGTNAHARSVGPAYSGISGYVCTHEGGNVMLRAGAGQNQTVLARMPSGSDVRILEERNVGGWTWYKVKFAGKIGYARADYICG